MHSVVEGADQGEQEVPQEAEKPGQGVGKDQTSPANRDPRQGAHITSSKPVTKPSIFHKTEPSIKNVKSAQPELSDGTPIINRIFNPGVNLTCNANAQHDPYTTNGEVGTRSTNILPNQTNRTQGHQKTLEHTHTCTHHQTEPIGRQQERSQ